MKSIKILLVVMLAALAITSCTYDEIAPRKVDVPATVSFSKDVLPIFNSSCNAAGCHTTGGQPPNLLPANAYQSLTLYGYVDLLDPQGSIVYVKITTGSMKQHATDQDRAIILRWIEQGAENN